MMPLVSILIPAYNVEPWIADTLRSALAQTWPRKEIIVVDDGSTDRTLAVVRSFASAGVVVATQPNQGAAAARNRASSMCSGDYVQWLDGDDILAPEKISTQMEALDRGATARTLLSCAWGTFMYRHSRARFTPSPLWCDLSPAEWLVRKMSHNVYMQTATWLVSRDLTEAAGPWNTRLLGDDDGEYFCRVLLASDGVRFVPDGKVLYRERCFGRLSRIGCSSDKMKAQYESMQLHIRYLLSLDDSDRSRAACVKYLQTWLITFIPDRPDIAAAAEQLAADLRGQLLPPRLSWKYEWIRRLFGWEWAKCAQRSLPHAKCCLLSRWDQLLFRLNEPRAPRNLRCAPPVDVND